MKRQKLETLALDIRKKIVGMAYDTRSGHIGSALSCVDILTALYFDFLNVDPKNPLADHRDRFILSKGHAANALYCALAKRGFFPEALLGSYLSDDSPLSAHPPFFTLAGIEFATGSLGHGLSVGVGIALSGKRSGKSYRTVVLLSDGECDEGSTWEAALSASQLKLDHLIAIVDYNKIQAFGKTEEVINLEPFSDKWKAFGFSVQEIDGHSMKEIVESLYKIPIEKNRPNLILAHTIKGKGISFLENTIRSHYEVLSKAQFEKAIEGLT